MCALILFAGFAFVVLCTDPGPTDRELARRERADWPRQDRAWAARDRLQAGIPTPFRHPCSSNPNGTTSAPR